MEELELTTPVTESKTTTKYRVVTLTLSTVIEIPPDVPGAIMIDLQDDHDATVSCSYSGQTAVDWIKWVNTANLTIKSLQKRILEKLSADGKLPPGTVTGTPDPVVPLVKEGQDADT